MVKYASLLSIVLVFSTCQTKYSCWNDEGKSFSVGNSDGDVLLSSCSASVEFTNGDCVSTNDDRFLVSEENDQNTTALSFHDKKNEFDFRLSLKLIEDESVRIDLDFANSGDSSVFINKIVSIKGDRAKSGFSKKPKVLITSENWQDENIVFELNENRNSVNSMYTVAIDEPSVAAGFLEGKKHFNHFTLSNETNSITISAWGEGNPGY